jgi:hypothetical protein
MDHAPPTGPEKLAGEHIQQSPTAAEPVRSPSPLPTAPSSQVLALQRLAGNQAVVRLLALKQREPADPGRGERVHAAGADQVNAVLSQIQKLTAVRIEAWEKTAHAPEAKISQKLLEATIAVVSLGIGGVALGWLEGLLKDSGHKLFEEFVELAGLEIADLGAEKLFHESVELIRGDLEAGVAKALQSRSKAAAAALAGKTDAVDAYAEALKLHSLTEEAAKAMEFNASAARLKPRELAARSAALKLTYDALLADPSSFLRQITIGFLKLLDDSRVAERLQDGDDRADIERAKMFRKDLGKLTLTPLPWDYSLGRPTAPDLGFPVFNASAEGVNNKTLSRLIYTEVHEIPVTMRFRFMVRPERGMKIGATMPTFTRTPDGEIILHGSPEDDEWKWFAAYHSGTSRELPEETIAAFAPRGAAKLYEATKHFLIGSTSTPN